MCIELNKNNKLLSFYKFSYTIELVYDRTGFSFKIHIFYDMGWGERDFFFKKGKLCKYPARKCHGLGLKFLFVLINF